MPFNPLNSFLTRPNCPKCGTQIYWGHTTHYDEKINSEVCTSCGTILGKE